MSPILASNFDGLIGILFGVPVVLSLLAAISFWPASRGHWSAPVISVVPALLGALFTFSLVTEGALFVFWFVFPLPFVIGTSSILLWSRRRGAKRKAASILIA
jgi:hypothetical protein